MDATNTVNPKLSGLQLGRSFYQRWSWAIVLVTVFMTPFAFFGAGRAVLSNVNRVEDWLPKSFDATKDLSWFRKNFASDQFIIVSWNDCRLGGDETGVGDDPRLAQLANLLVPNSVSPSAIDESSASQSVEWSEKDRELCERYFKNVVTGRTVLQRLTSAPLSLPEEVARRRLSGTMIGPDGAQTCLIVTLKPEALGELRHILGHGQRRIFRDNVPPGVLVRALESIGITSDSVHLGGPPVDNSAIDEEGERTLVRLAGVSGLLGLTLAYWSLRSVVLTSIVFFCGVISAATSLAMVWLTGQTVDAILMSMPSLVYVLAISGAVHLVNYFREAVETEGLDRSAERAVMHAWKPALLCSVTTAVGLLSLLASELVPIRKFGVYSAIGVMNIVAIVYFFLPAALHLTKIGRRWESVPGKVKQASPQRDEARHGFWEHVARWIVQHYRFVGSCCLIVTVVAGYGLRFTSSSIDLLKLFDSRARILQDYRWLEANIGKLVPLEIVVRFPVALQQELTVVDTQPDLATLSFLQRMETVVRIQSIIESQFGSGGDGIVGRSLSAASFAPNTPGTNSGNYNYIQRKAIEARMLRSKQELSEAGYYRVDSEDGSELWRISLRVAAFKDVDYGQFVSELEMATQPLLDAYHARTKVLSELAKFAAEDTTGPKRVLLWGYCEPDSPSLPMQETFQIALSQLLKEHRCEVIQLYEDPRLSTLAEFDSLDAMQAVVVYGDFRAAELQLLQAEAPRVIDMRYSESAGKDGTVTLASTAGLEKNTDVSATFTGVVPIVYQAQRALLNSLTSSTWWSFLTITPIMMLVSRSIKAGLIAMIPNLLPIFLIFGGMGWLGIPLDIGSMMTASIALGVAVDDTIHFLARYREELNVADDHDEAIVGTYAHCAVPTLQAALISGLGLSVFAFSTFTPTQRFGWLMLFILLAGVVSELILLPAILASPIGRVFRSQKGDASKKETVLKHPASHLRSDTESDSVAC